MTAIPAEPTGRRSPGIRGDRGRGHRSRPAECAGQAVTGADIRVWLAGLAAEHRQVIVEIYYHSRSVHETAEFLQVPVSTVASRAYNAVRDLPRAIRSPRASSSIPG